MKFDWKKALTTAAVLAFGTIVAILSNRDGDEDEFSNWLESASDDELSDGYEQRRQEWAHTGFGGNGEKTPEMKMLDNEIGRRSAEKWLKNPKRNTDPNYHWSDANRWDKD